MTALNKTIRQAIIDSVIEKGTTIPARKEALKKKTSLRVREIQISCISKEFPDATKILPQEWFPVMASTQIPPQVCPDSYIELTDDEMRRHWRAVVSFEPFHYPVNTDFYRKDYLNQGEEKKPNKESWEAKLDDLIKEAKKIREDETHARDQLRLFLASVNNYKQVLEKMPELERHLPNYTKPMPLTVPVAPILRTLGKLGFDQTEKEKT